MTEKTGTLIDKLAGDLKPVRRGLVDARLLGCFAAGLITSSAALLVFLGVQAEIAREMTTSPFYLKTLYVLGIAAAGFAAMRCASVPARSPFACLGLAGGLMALTIAAGMVQLGLASAEAVPRLLFGDSWRQCAPSILLLSIPIYAALAFAVRSLAPTRLRLAGLSIGLCAGGTAGALYALHCTETSLAFTAAWYSLGVAAPAALGALLGPVMLRWK